MATMKEQEQDDTDIGIIMKASSEWKPLTEKIRHDFLAAISCKDVNIDQVRMLLRDENIDVNDYYEFKNSNRWSALMIACWNGHYGLANLLISEEADINLQNDEGQSALIIASKNGFDKVVKLLLENGAKVNQQDLKKWSALKKACYENRYEVVELLLKHGAAVDLQDDKGWTALMNACRHGHYELAKLLLEKDADPNIQRISGRSALMAASENGRTEVVELLLKYHAQVDMKDYDCGRTALMYASLNGHYNVCRRLIASFEGNLVNFQDEQGQSALMLASIDGQREIVRLLLGKGAKVDLLDKDGQSALHLAKIKKHHEVVRLFQAPVYDESAWTRADSPSTYSKAKGSKGILKTVKKHFPTLTSVFSQSAQKKRSRTESLGCKSEDLPLVPIQRTWSSPPLISDERILTAEKEVHDSSAPAIETYATIKTYTCDQLGDELTADDITVTIPPGAIPEGATVHIEMGVALYVPFQFPDNHQPVSPILWFCIKEDMEPLLPVTYKLPHMITDISRVKLTFAKAGHTDNPNFELLHHNNANFTPSNPHTNEYGYGVLSTKHCCYLCIGAYTQGQALKSGYCLHTLIKKEDDSHYQILLLCTYFLKTCFEALETSYPKNEGYEYYSTEPFEFEDSCLGITPTSEDDLKIKTKFGNEIRATAVNFWEGGPGRRYRMKMEHDNKIYPPSVTILVYSNTPGSRKAEVTINIKGMREPTPSTITVVKEYTIGSSSANSHFEQLLDWDNDTERDLIKIAYHMLQWEETLCPHLGLTHESIHDIKEIYKDNPELQRREVLRRWKGKQGQGATYGKLLEVFMKVDDFDCTKALLDMVKNKHS